MSEGFPNAGEINHPSPDAVKFGVALARLQPKSPVGSAAAVRFGVALQKLAQRPPHSEGVTISEDALRFSRALSTENLNAAFSRARLRAIMYEGSAGSESS